MLDVDHTSARLNLLTPRYVNQKGVALLTSSATTRRIKRESLQQKQILVPELCDVHPFPASLWRKAVCIPAMFYRTNCLLIAEELRTRIAGEARIGSSVACSSFPPLRFEYSNDPPPKLDESVSETANGSEVTETRVDVETREEGVKNDLFINDESSVECDGTASVNVKNGICKLLNKENGECILVKGCSKIRCDCSDRQHNLDCNGRLNHSVRKNDLGDVSGVDSKFTESFDSKCSLNSDKNTSNSQTDSGTHVAGSISGEKSCEESSSCTDKTRIAAFSLDADTSSEGRPGPCDILQTLTMSNANDFFNLERLETIGDSFLKFAVTIYLYCTYTAIHEGKLSYLRSLQV